MTEMLLDAVGMVFQPANIGVAMLGIMLGTILGAIPGLTATMGIALLLPVTYYMDPVTAIILLTAMYKGGLYGGSVTGILFSTPGTPAAAFTVIDGYKMTQKGEGGKALKVALIASFTGDLFANLVLIFSAAILASMALAFGAPEYATLIVFSFTTIIGLSRGSMLKGFIATAMGVFFGMISFDPVSAEPRFAFGSDYLAGGMNLIPVLIGLLAVSEVLRHLEETRKGKGDVQERIDVRVEKQGLSFREIWDIRGVLLRSSIIGTGIGALPGLGAGLAAFMGYQNAKTVGKNRHKVGTGVAEGVAGPEASNSATGSANLIPLVALGIPGDGEAAMILSVMVLHGITPGPRIFEQNGSLIYAIMFGILLATFFNLLLNWFLTRHAARVSTIPFQYVMPVVLITAVAGSYGIHQSMFDVYVMVFFAILGYLMTKFGFSTIALLIGFILGPMLESSVRTSMIMSGGSMDIFFTRPITVGLLTASLLVILWNVWKTLRR
ncbi:MAG: tripartite tricarboxylate transporter permease [Aquisalimonadaceae bacterium]